MKRERTVKGKSNGGFEYQVYSFRVEGKEAGEHQVIAKNKWVHLWVLGNKELGYVGM